MKILITGNMGYVGPSVALAFRRAYPDAQIIGFDTCFFGHCLTFSPVLPERTLDAQYFGDVRHFPAELLEAVDTVVHLAAVSNDPMGKRFELATRAINYQATVELAEAAKHKGVKRFVFASSCSVYGSGGDAPRTEDSPVDPLTAYAHSKIDSEKALERLADEDFQASCLRFATACGMTPRCRLDLVLNDFVASALTHEQIKVLSDGTPWRPLIHVDDMARAMVWASERLNDFGGYFLKVNVGSDKWNYQVKDLANVVSLSLGVPLEINTNAAPDKRSYRVDFSRYRILAPKAQPQVSLGECVEGLVTGLRSVLSREEEFRQARHTRLGVLSDLIDRGLLDDTLHWTDGKIQTKTKPLARVSEREADVTI